jgi:hypothetical protein
MNAHIQKACAVFDVAEQHDIQALTALVAKVNQEQGTDYSPAHLDQALSALTAPRQQHADDTLPDFGWDRPDTMGDLEARRAMTPHAFWRLWATLEKRYDNEMTSFATTFCCIAGFLGAAGSGTLANQVSHGLGLAPTPALFITGATGLIAGAGCIFGLMLGYFAMFNKSLSVPAQCPDLKVITPRLGQIALWSQASSVKKWCGPA